MYVCVRVCVYVCVNGVQGVRVEDCLSVYVYVQVSEHVCVCMYACV